MVKIGAKMVNVVFECLLMKISYIKCDANWLIITYTNKYSLDLSKEVQTKQLQNCKLAKFAVAKNPIWVA